ncbi:MAG TPA: prolyl oligopeptidase family serine peptidase [Balneolaceae bacterium]
MNIFRYLLLASLLLFLNFAPLMGQASKWTVNDIINQESASALQFSPDGKSIVWVKTHPDREKDRDDRDLYLTLLDVKEGGKYKTIQLTRGHERDYNPVFSTDGQTIYFLSSKDDGKKIWGMSVYGGEPYEVGSFDTGVSNLQRLGDQKLVFRSTEGPTLYEQMLKKEEDNTIVVEDTAHFKASRVYSFDPESKEVKRLTDNDFPVREFEVSPDGKWLVTSHTMSPDYGVDANPKPTHYLWNLETGSKQQILKDGYQTPGNFEFTDNNKGFYFVSVKSSDPKWSGAGITLLHYYSLESRDAQLVPIDWDWGLGSGFDIIGNDILVGLANGTTNKLTYFEKDGDDWTKKLVDAGSMNEHVTVTSVAADNNYLVYVYSTASVMPQYRLAEIDVNRRSVDLPAGTEVIDLNENLDDKYIARSEVVSWTGALGDEVTGILYYPEDYEPGRQYPLIVSIHGGPSGVDMDRWSDSWAYFPNIYSQKGAFVLNPNYHGSGNHGLEFVESIKGHYYEYEIPDIIAGIKMLDDKGMIDRDSLGVKGWSNGAILTTMLTVKYPDMFQVAAPGAGDVNWTSDYGTCSFGVSFDQSYFNGAPWDNTNGKIFNETYVLKSPLFEMEKVRTPTIIFHGSKDRAVPRDQGWEYYRALQQIGKAPVRFLWFPNQPHSLQKITHRTRKMEEEIRWFDKYLFGTYEPENEAFKEESPIAEFFKKEKAQTADGFYGVMDNGTLIPETVSIKEDSIAIGRFEITNAQFAEFDEGFDYPVLKANYPATGISLERARNYIEWLSEKTGETFRLPTEEEAEKLHEQARKVAASENTLNYWAGYDITIDEVPEFRQKLEQLDHSLLKAAGSFDAVKVGNAWIYDLGGNAAELYRSSEHQPIYGYSAVSFMDEYSKTSTAPENYIGFRVIKVSKSN